MKHDNNNNGDHADNDKKAFEEAMRSVTPLGNKNTVPPTRKKTPFKKAHSQTDDNVDNYGLTDHEQHSVTSESTLQFKRDGVQARYFKKLKLGSFSIEAELDLHGSTVEEARNELSHFIQGAYNSGLRVIRVIHGKGYRGQQTKPIIKNKVNTWLPQIPEVLAFSSCQPRDGGSGAVYVLLKK